MFENIDCLMFYVPDVDEGIDYYHKKLGLKIAWKSQGSAGFLMNDNKTEIVIQSGQRKVETDVKVKSVLEVVDRIQRAGGNVVVGPFDIQIGKCAVIEDPWKNRMVILDATKGTLKTDKEGNIIGQNAG
jgi:lactoylglutathione lyase